MKVLFALLCAHNTSLIEYRVQSTEYSVHTLTWSRKKQLTFTLVIVCPANPKSTILPYITTIYTLCCAGSRATHTHNTRGIFVLSSGSTTQRLQNYWRDLPILHTHTYIHSTRPLRNSGGISNTLRKVWSQSLLEAVWNIFKSTWSAVNVFPAPDTPLMSSDRGVEDKLVKSLSTNCFKTFWVDGDGVSNELTATSTGPTHVCRIWIVVASQWTNTRGWQYYTCTMHSRSSLCSQSAAEVSEW